MIVEEPIAAVLYRVVKLEAFLMTIKQIWLTFDIGGGTLDVALVEVGNYVLKTKAIDGDQFLGGQDFDHAIMQYFIDKYVEECIENNEEPKINSRMKAKFKQKACLIKELLSVS